MDEKEFAWRLYESERDFIKHHENQRTNASSILAAISAALVVAIASGAASGPLQLLVGVVLTLVGVFGSVFSGKLYELIQLHAARSYRYLEIVNSHFPDISIADIKLDVKSKQKEKYPYLSGLSLNKIWFRFHLLVAFLGLVITGSIAFELMEIQLPAPQ